MCGRYSLTIPGMELLAEAGLALTDVPDDWVPRFNIAPSQDVPVVLDEAPSGITLVRWGLLPPWAKDEKMGHRLINARADTAAEKPAFRDAFAHRRCLVLADGFYEWERRGKHKVPHYFRLKSRAPFAFAGLWERFQSPEAGWIRTCTILTTDANELVAPLHYRMPVILMPHDTGRWLSKEVDDTQLRALLSPLGRDALEEFEVSPVVNSPVNDVPECVEPPPPGEGKKQLRLFD